MKCLTAKPIVNGIEKDLEGRAEVIRMNVVSKLGKTLARRYDIKGIPATLVFGGDGDLVHRHAGLPNRKAIVAHATAS